MLNIKIEIKWALITFFFALCWMAMERLIGLHDQYIYLQSTLTMFIIFPTLLINYLFFNEKKEHFYLGKMNFTQGLEAGFRFAFFNLLFNPVFQWITSSYITPNYFQNAINYSVSRRKMLQEDAESFFNFTNYMSQSIIGSIVFSIVLTLVFAFFMRTRMDEIDD